MENIQMIMFVIISGVHYFTLVHSTIHHVEVIRISDDGRFHKIDSNNFHEILLYFSSNFNDYSNE